MDVWTKLISLGIFTLLITACNAEPEVTVDSQLTDGDAAAIELTTQVDGVFKGYVGEDQNSIIIESEGQENTYEIAEDARGDFDKLQLNDPIAYSTKMVDGKEMIETLRLN